METDGIFIEVVDVNLVVLMVAACFLAHAVVEGILFLVHVGSLTAASAARIFVDIRVLVDDVLGHELVLVGLLDPLLALQLVLIAVLAVGDDGAQLTLACKHLDNGVLDILDVKDVCIRQVFLLAELKHLVGILLCRSLNVALVADGLQVL